jgi:hypothetical protein
VASRIANDTPTQSATFNCTCERDTSPNDSAAESSRESALSKNSDTRLSGRTRTAYRVWQVSCRLYLATTVAPRGNALMDTTTFAWLIGSGAFLVVSWWRDRAYYRTVDDQRAVENGPTARHRRS